MSTIEEKKISANTKVALSSLLNHVETKRLVPIGTVGTEPTPEEKLKKTIAWHSKNPFFDRTLHHTILLKCSDTFWTSPTKIACWFCGYKFKTPPIPLPVKYKNGKFEVSGIYCSFTCVKSQIVQQPGYYFNERIECLTLMLNDVYEYTGTVPTVTKEIFKKYGGKLSHQKYLKNHAIVEKIKIRSIPFVDQPLVLEQDFKDIEMARPKMKKAKVFKDTKESKVTSKNNFEDMIPVLKKIDEEKEEKR
jgi:hypothetical protein